MPRKTTQRPPRRHTVGKGGGSGTPADRLIRAWLDEDYDAFEDLAQELIAGGRDGVLSAAVRKLSERYEDDAVEEFAAALTEAAEAAEGQDGFDFAELVLLPLVSSGPLPDPAALTNGLADAGIFPAEAEVIFAEGWNSAESVLSLSPSAIRRVLLDVANGQSPADLPALPSGSTTEGGVAVLVGAVAFRTEPPSDDPDADPEVLTAADEARESERSDAFDRWRDSLPPDVTRSALVLPFCVPSELVDEIRALMDAADAENPALDEIIDFVATARDEAGGEEVVARLVSREGGVQLTVLTRSGRELDSRVFGREGGRLMAEEVRRAVEGVVPILDANA
jgi:hypothetical protein